MRKLCFETACAESFLARISPLWSQDEFTPQLVGDNDLAQDLLEIASQEGVVLHRGGVLVEEGKTPLIILTEQAGDALHAELMSYLQLSTAIIVAPVTDWHFSKRPLFLISIPKAGTHLLYELASALGYHPGVEMPEFPRGQNWYCVEYENSHTKASDFFVDTVRRAPFGNRHHSFSKSPAIFIYRHPLDVLVSEAHYYHLDGKTIFAGWLDKLDFPARVERLLADNGLFGSLRNRITDFLPWLDFPNVIKISFEELVGTSGGGSGRDQLDLIWSIILKLQVPGDPEEIGRGLFNSHSATFRSGKIGSYHLELPLEVTKNFEFQNKDVLDKLGYTVDGKEMLPSHRLIFREQHLIYSKNDFELKPINLEVGFMGCNLVRYAHRIYALPISAGKVDLEAMPGEFLKLLPSASTLQDLKALLLVGHEGVSQRLDALHKLGATLRDQKSTDGFYQFWQETGTPSLIEERGGFNVIFFQNKFYGIRMSLGEVDITINLEKLLESYSIDDFIVASSISQLHDEIDQIAVSHRLRRQVYALGVKHSESQEQSKGDLVNALAQLSAGNALMVERFEALEREITASRDMIEKRFATYQIFIDHAQRKLTDDFEQRLREIKQEIDTTIATKFNAISVSFTDATRQQEWRSAELREMFEKAISALKADLQSTLVAQQSEVDRHTQMIAALLQSWPLRLARRVKGFAGRKK